MEVVLFTQRVEIIESYNERRDCADQNIPRFIEECGYIPIAIPNIPSVAEIIVNKLRPKGIILTGGNSLVKYGGDSIEKDLTDRKVIEMAIKKDIPIYGFCRGMQSILDYFNIELVDIINHVAVKHKLMLDGEELLVNSYHNQAAMNIKEPLKVLAYAEDGVIEAICHSNKKIIGTMWHPERENPFKESDIIRVKRLFK
ncbi:gamma-glutamyl-gamma-aminobutyrate hydrolase family protein [Clostridium saccharoperbutylacetonicum]|uniref:gamma-glutamyl-gamma-aminobutyrate hydrolase family protein n=1 Tax=Clostridium saccharoperbutylacetonicum TaxID=36745 RepID=UPI000983B2D6|nr:gamma-glutamyl-gamma-aminobutyrate hydrolase family protein [Clostridium saccharoperbutylacetonicum]AQR97008.1 gamma-glutamyl-gamma-aminobutyrate hydrolase PuuD [Clostridium saccharoperbutylacetonicum]NSB32887.1 putative glutamine amidotransferase [Clostridium saccharoperbutylacetonicum]